MSRVSMATPLPPPRDLLTSLLTTLFNTPHSPASNINPPYSAQPSTQTYQQPANPLLNLPASQRALLTTLHVLFPPPTLLQALDLLDRGLVTRIILKHADAMGEEEMGEGLEGTVIPAQAGVHLPPSASFNQPHPEDDERSRKGNESRRNGRAEVYLVRSSQPTSGKGRFRDSISASAAMYTVHLEAWNCSCAAFTFSSLPATQPWTLGSEDGDQSWGEREVRGEKWEFGGLSQAGKDGGGVPVCKHLLACLLGEKWGVLRGFVKERSVGREEMAGLAGEG